MQFPSRSDQILKTVLLLTWNRNDISTQKVVLPYANNEGIELTNLLYVLIFIEYNEDMIACILTLSRHLTKMSTLL